MNETQSAVPFGDYGWGVLTLSPKLKHGALIGVYRQSTVWNLIYDATNKAHRFNGGYAKIHPFG